MNIGEMNLTLMFYNFDTLVSVLGPRPSSSSYVMLCYVMLCYVILCYVMLCYVMLCYVMLCFVISDMDN